MCGVHEADVMELDEDMEDPGEGDGMGVCGYCGETYEGGDVTNAGHCWGKLDRGMRKGKGFPA